MKEYKRANGTGSVYKLSGRRSKPFIAIVTQACFFSVEKGRYIQKRTPIGYYRNRDDAITALSEYRGAPYDLNRKDYTFRSIYMDWSREHFVEIVPSAVRTWKSAYNYLEPIHELRFADIRTKDIEKCIEQADVHSTTKKRMKSLCNMLYKYAIKNEIVKINYSSMCNTIKSDPPVYKRNPFTREEIAALWNISDRLYVDMILTGIYSGWRPQELAKIRVSDVNIDEGIITGGMKTQAGQNRIVPIHSRIKELIKARYEYATNNNLEYLFDMKNKKINYDIYRRFFISITVPLNMEHRPHDTRHTFITLAKESNIDEYILKLLVGHATNDITERVYTHRSIESLKSEIEKIDFDL